MFASDSVKDPTVSLIAQMGIYVLIGALLHIAEDGICGRVPILTPKSKHGIKLFQVGSIGEYIVAALIIAICIFSRFGDIGKTLDILFDSVHKFV